MVRSEEFMSGKEQLDQGITTELDSRPGLYNIGNQWIASGILEWARRNLYNEIKNNVYDVMISAAERIPSGCNGVKVIPDFYNEMKGKPGDRSSALLWHQPVTKYSVQYLRHYLPDSPMQRELLKMQEDLNRKYPLCWRWIKKQALEPVKS